MIPAKNIVPQNWMMASEAETVMNLLGGDEMPPKALFVGGCVRNMLLEKPLSDIDIATLHRPDTVMNILAKAGIRAIATGLVHGTVTAIVNDAKFEITTLRKDVETDGRHAVIAFTDLWEEDAERRDFTMNTLLASPHGDIYDPTGKGLDDLDQRRVVFVGEASQRIAEDYLRILRFFRFHGQYGQGPADQTALEACQAYADKIRNLSKERITQEFVKIVELTDPTDILDLMFGRNVLAPIRGGKYKSESMTQLCALQTRYEVPDIMARLNLISGFDLARVEEWLVLSNLQRAHFVSMAKAYEGMGSISKKKIRELVYHHGNAVVMQAYLLKMASGGNHPDLEIIDIARYWLAPVFPIGGKELQDAGILPGRDMGKKLKALEEKWIKSDFKTLPKI